ncbi:hypothetical protein D3C81_1685110 [compost metagenome]
MRTMSAVSTALSVPFPMAIPRLEAARAGASLIPSPTMATFQLAESSRIFSTFCSGRSPADQSVTPALSAIALAEPAWSPVSMTVWAIPLRCKSAITCGLSGRISSARPNIPNTLWLSAARTTVSPSSLRRLRSCLTCKREEPGRVSSNKEI